MEAMAPVPWNEADRRMEVSGLKRFSLNRDDKWHIKTVHTLNWVTNES